MAEACETMLTDTDAAQRIGQSLKAKDATLFEKVKQWFRDLADKIRKAYKGLHPDSEIAQYAKKTIQQVDGLVQLWADMAVDAAENYSTFSVKTKNNSWNSGESMYSLREFVDGTRFVDVQLPANTFDGMTVSAMNLSAKKVLMDKFAGKIIGIDNRVFVNGDSVNEYLDPSKSIDITTRKAKLTAAGELDNILDAGKALPNEPDGKDGHVHPDAIDFSYFQTIFKIGSEYFEGIVNVKNIKRGKLLKDVTKIRNITKDIVSSYGQNPKSNFLRDASMNSIRNIEPIVNKKNSDRIDVESDFYNAGVKYSSRVTDKDTLSFLDNQETITTYKTMQIVDGKLYPPMAARIDGKHEDYSVLGVWEQATEHPELIKGNGKFKLDKGKGQGSIEAAYNPYMHSSNLVINDQFTGAYTRDNLVTVECEVPASELTSGYHAQYAKDSVGWHAWHTGTVAGAIRKAKGIERQVFLSRWIKPVRIVSDSEVASMYKDLLDGTDIAVPDNVVTPSLLSELKKAGVTISESGRVMNSGDPGKKISNTGLVEPTSTADAADRGNTSANSIRNPEQVVNKKFSMRDNVEKTKDLIAVHNLSEEKLLKSLNLGGLPMPSIAILRAKDGHNKFGDISLVFSKDTIDPELSRVNKVYSADAWTPTYPKIDYKANDRVEDRISSKYNELVKRFGYDAAKPLYRYAFHVCNIGCWVWA